MKSDYSLLELYREPKVSFEELTAMMIGADTELAKKERILARNGIKV